MPAPSHHMPLPPTWEAYAGLGEVGRLAHRSEADRSSARCARSAVTCLHRRRKSRGSPKRERRV